MPTDLDVTREPIVQPNTSDTKKAQKKALQPSEYNALAINTELDFIHERLNRLTAEEDGLILTSGATLGDVIDRINAIQRTLQNAGLLTQS